MDTPRQSDWGEWCKLYHGYARFYHMPMHDEILRRVWGWIIDPDTNFYALVARDSERLAGLMHYRAMPSPLRGAEVGFLDDLYIHPDYRCKGVARQMFGELERIAAHHNWLFVRWITADDNHRARTLYNRLATPTTWRTYQLDPGG